MMTLKIQIVIGIILIISFLFIINMIRKKSLELKYSLMWLVLVGALFILDCFPRLLEIFAGFLGIQDPINMIFFLGFLFSLGIIFILTVMLSRLSDRIRKLTQRMALDDKKRSEENENK
jgi:hypothetical protein